jgi:hypothetical protein
LKDTSLAIQSGCLLGYRWKVGDGRKIKFWEDNWLGSSSLAIQFWELYVIVNEKSATIQELWDGESLKCTFRRTVGERLMNMWDEVVQLATTICFSNEEDNLIWHFSSNGIYSSQSLYKIINNRVLPIFMSVVWSLKVPPRIHLVAVKKTRTSRDNLQKRREVRDKTCLFCAELGTCNHLFFECAW